jgi:hypothetical protein
MRPLLSSSVVALALMVVLATEAPGQTIIRPPRSRIGSNAPVGPGATVIYVNRPAAVPSMGYAYGYPSAAVPFYGYSSGSYYGAGFGYVYPTSYGLGSGIANPYIVPSFGSGVANPYIASGFGGYSVAPYGGAGLYGPGRWTNWGGIGYRGRIGSPRMLPTR